MRTLAVSVLPLLLFMAAEVAVSKPWFFVPLRVETRYPNGDPHQYHVSSSSSSAAATGENKGVGVDSWEFVGSRNDPGDDDRENRCGGSTRSWSRCNFEKSTLIVKPQRHHASLKEVA